MKNCDRRLLSGVDAWCGLLTASLPSSVFVIKGRFVDITLSEGNGGVFGVLSSISCTSARCQSCFSNQVVLDSIFFDCVVNDTFGSGGAIYFTDSVLVVQRSIFVNNAAGSAGFGGAIVAEGAARLNVDNGCTFQGNSAGYGGSVAGLNIPFASINDATFLDDVAWNQVCRWIGVEFRRTGPRHRCSVLCACRVVPCTSTQ